MLRNQDFDLLGLQPPKNEFFISMCSSADDLMVNLETPGNSQTKLIGQSNVRVLNSMQWTIQIWSLQSIKAQKADVYFSFLCPRNA